MLNKIDTEIILFVLPNDRQEEVPAELQGSENQN